MIDKKVFRETAPRTSWCAWCGTEADLELGKPCGTCGLYGRTYFKPVAGRPRGLGR